MLKQTITYDDLDGNKVTDDFYFHLNRAELTEMMLVKDENPEVWIKRIEQSNLGSVVYPEFRKLIMATVGQRSPDGKRFIKNDEIRSAFEESDAYGVFLIDLLQTEGAGAAFVRGVMPAGMESQIDENIAKQEAAKASVPPQLVKLPETPAEGYEVDAPQVIDDGRPAWIREDRDPTIEEFQKMTPQEQQAAFARKINKGRDMTPTVPSSD